MNRTKLTKLIVSILVALVAILLVSAGLGILEAANILGQAIADIFSIIWSGLIGIAWAMYVSDEGVL